MLNKLAIAFTATFIGLTGVALAQQSGGATAGDRPSAVECKRPIHMAGCGDATDQTLSDYR